ncbi:protein MAATS1-like [Scleropages formosus]|uniref:Cilia- and flagella-associated protein 91 n=1 Tax=Scleropages formosus TaxID=113540 RepID=A0A0P7ULF5_SCLFO|nr:protein MAATS1-like [Scleropages formosus]
MSESQTRIVHLRKGRGFKGLCADCAQKKVPEYENMFSNLPHYPHYTLRVDANDPVPAWVERRWRGRAEERKAALQQLVGSASYSVSTQTFLVLLIFICSAHVLHINPAVHCIQIGAQDNCKIAGQDRWKYFKRPLVPFSSQIPADVVFTLPKGNAYSSSDKTLEHPQTPFQQTVGVQTDYRESEAQTDPYTPDYVIRPGSAPELLTLATLTWGACRFLTLSEGVFHPLTLSSQCLTLMFLTCSHWCSRGLPVGLAEVEMIERARMKRAWETTLPPLHDVSQLDKRRRMMEEMERKEWAFRANEIQKLQEMRLALLMRLLQQREKRQHEATQKRLELFFSQRQQDTEARIKKIRNDYASSIRKLIAKRRNVEGKLERRDIVKDYSDYASQVYAPPSHLGLLPDPNSKGSAVNSRFLGSYQAILELEASLPASVTQPRISSPKAMASKGFVTRAARHKMELTKTYEALKVKKEKTERPLRFLYRTEKAVSRPPTPVVAVCPEGDEEKELAVIFLQKLLRGRAVQNMMFEGKEKRLELIQELRTTHALQHEEQEQQRADRQLTLTLQKQRELQQQKASMEEGLLSGVSGGILSDMLDFLSKELVRLQEEQRLHALELLAERDRRRREAEESGRRQVEERRRREEDEIFKQVVQVHQETVDLYLEDIILGTIEQTADNQAREEIHKMAQEINNIAYAMEETRTRLQSEEIVAELVYSFLIPEVQKATIRERGRF